MWGLVSLTTSAAVALGLTTSVGSLAAQLAMRTWRTNHTVLAVPVDGRQPLALTAEQVSTLEILPGEADAQWRLRLRSRWWVGPRGPLHLEGDSALRVLSRVMPFINEGGGSRKAINTAVTLLEHEAPVEERVAEFAGQPPQTWYHRYVSRSHPYLAQHPLERRLALEMLLREGIEERSMRGELWLLEREWRAAEAIAAIADSLLVPESVENRFAETRDEAERLKREDA